MTVKTIGHCSKCLKIWTLETRQGVCQWCGQSATCQTTQPQGLRSIKSRSKRQAPVNELSYEGLIGEWAYWLEVARRYEVKVPYQDRDDIRHDIMMELHRATYRDNEPLPLLRAYRIASLMIALYWRELNKSSVKVCLYNGLPTEPDCAGCNRKPKEGTCPYIALRPIQSLDSEVTDTEGNRVRLIDTVADDHAIDLDAWQDAKAFRLGCPMRLIQIADKRRMGIPLDRKERTYLTHYQTRQLKKSQQALF